MRKIGRYRIERQIGRGSMGVVYLAYDPRLERRVALKTFDLPSGLSEARRKEFHERFLREARAAALLSHAAIVTVYDAGEDPASGIPFIAMEYLEGQSLQDLLEQEIRLPRDRALAIASELAKALAAAHRVGVIHRDIKTANILIRKSDGAVKISDFGLARLATSTLTHDGDFVGSPAYMSPEQLRGEPIDGRSDLFSLAVVLYEMLCGERPFKGTDISSLTYTVVNERPTPTRHHVPDLPAELDRLFDRALAKNPDERFQDGRALADAILVARGETMHSAHAAPAGSARARHGFPLGSLAAWLRARRPRTLALYAAGVLLLMGLLLTGLMVGADSSPPMKPPVPGAPSPEPPPARASLLASPHEPVPGPAAASEPVPAPEPEPQEAEPASVSIRGESKIREGVLRVFVDEIEVFSCDLSRPRNFLGMGAGAQTFGSEIALEPGLRRVSARVELADSPVRFEQEAELDLQAGDSRVLRLELGRRIKKRFTLTVD